MAARVRQDARLAAGGFMPPAGGGWAVPVPLASSSGIPIPPPGGMTR
jgi:hypothetical protein